jgi:hypothetical protein
VSDYFLLNSGTSAYTPVRGNVIYINPARLQTADPSRNEALMMHEILHNEWGLDDGDVLDALYGNGARNTRASVDISNWFRTHSTRGGGNF